MHAYLKQHFHKHYRLHSYNYWTQHLGAQHKVVPAKRSNPVASSSSISLTHARLALNVLTHIFIYTRVQHHNQTLCPLATKNTPFTTQKQPQTPYKLIKIQKCNSTVMKKNQMEPFKESRGDPNYRGCETCQN